MNIAIQNVDTSDAPLNSGKGVLRFAEKGFLDRITAKARLESVYRKLVREPIFYFKTVSFGYKNRFSRLQGESNLDGEKITVYSKSMSVPIETNRLNNGYYAF